MVPRNVTAIDVQLTAEEQEDVRCAAALHARHLETLATNADKCGKAGDAKAYRKEADGLKAEIVDREGTLVLYEHQRDMLELGLRALVKNMRAAKGTLTPLPGTADWIQELDERADAVQEQTLPKIAAQQELGVAASGKDAAAGEKTGTED